MRKKKNLIIIVIVIISILGGFIFTIGSYQKSIYEDNSKIISKFDSSFYLNQVSNKIGGVLKSKFRFTGMDTVYKLNAKEDGTISVNYNVNITSGKFKIVLISPDNEVITILEGSGEGNKEILLTNGKSRLKLVGNNAKGNIEISINTKNNIKIK